MKKMTIPMVLCALSCVLSVGCASRVPVEKTVPSGTELKLELVDSVSSAESQAGEGLQARVLEEVVIDGHVAIPAGSNVSGRVVAVHGLKAIGGRAFLSLEFTSVDTPSGEVPIHAAWSRVGKSETRKDAAIIGGSAAGGAILGRILSDHDKGKGTLVGGLVGGAAGTAVAAGTKGEEIQLPSGTTLTVHLRAPVTLTIDA